MNIKARSNQPVWLFQVILLFLAVFQAVAADNFWANPISGNWEDTTNWTNGSIPDRFDDAELGLLGKYSVWLHSNRTVRSISIPNPDASLELLQGAELVLLQSLENNGQVWIDPDQDKAHTQLIFNNTQTISGMGRLTLGSPDAVLRFAENQVVTQEYPHQIEGIGIIQGDLVNRGVLHANAGGVLEFYQSDLEQEATGIVRASGVESIFQLNRSYILGGKISTSDGGKIRIEGYGGISQSEIADELLIETTSSGFIVDSQLLDAKITYLDENGSSLHIGAGNELLGAGSFILDSTHPNGHIQFEQHFILPESYQIRGHGKFTGIDFTNNSLVLADQPGKVLVAASGLTNNGLIGAENGATLMLTSSIQNDKGKIYASGEDSKILIQNSSVFIDNGTIQTLEGAIVENDGNLYINNTLMLCEIQSKPKSFISMAGLIYHDQPIVIDDATLKLENHAFIYGPGAIHMQGDLAHLAGDGYSFTDFTNGIGHRIEGSGIIGTLPTTFINGGVVSANSAGETLRITRYVNNYGRIEAAESGILYLYEAYIIQSEDAVISAIGSGSRVDLGGPSDTSRLYTIQGGEIRGEQGGYFGLKLSSRLTDVVINTDIIINDHSILGVDGTCEINGLIDLVPAADSGGKVQVFEPYSLQGAGTIRLGSPDDSARIMGGLPSDPLVIETDFRVEGEGYLWGYFICNGTLSPGLDLGMLFCSQDLVLTDLSTLEIDVSPTSSDVLHCESTAILNGTINIKFIDDFSPIKPWSREIIRSEGLKTNLVTLNMPEPSKGLASRYFYNETTLRIGQSYLSDMNLDGIQDFNDVSVFLDTYLAGDLRADLNFDMRLNYFDIATFIQSHQNAP